MSDNLCPKCSGCLDEIDDVGTIACVECSYIPSEKRYFYDNSNLPDNYKLKAKCGKEINTDVGRYFLRGELDWCLHNCKIDVYECDFWTKTLGDKASF